MKLSTIYGFAFICVPKTGSTSIERTISEHSTISYGWKHSLKHMPAKVLHSHILPFHVHLFPDCDIEISCIIRNPLDWVMSWYKYRTRKELLEMGESKSAMYTGNMSFESFVDLIIDSESPAGKQMKIGKQARYMTFDNGQLAVDKVFRFEDGFGKVETYFSGKIGSKIEFPTLNKSPHRDISVEPDLLSKIEQAFAEDYELYESVRCD